MQNEGRDVVGPLLAAPTIFSSIPVDERAARWDDHCLVVLSSGEACVREGKTLGAANDKRKPTANKRIKPKQSVKLRHQDWYIKAAAALSIRSSNVPSPSIAPE